MPCCHSLRVTPLLRALSAVAALACTHGLPAAEPAPPAQFSGIYPHLAALSTSYSESGIGAVVPWADRLWYVSYVAHKAGEGVGLYEITPDLKITRRAESIVGTHAGRMIHRETNQLVIGPYVIDQERSVRIFRWLAENERVTAVMRHLVDPERKIYFMAMEGKLYEGDLRTLESREIIDLKKHLAIVGNAHFKGAYTAQGRVVVANNSYNEKDQRAGSGEGRLAEWDGKTWTILQRTAFCDVTTASGIGAVPDDRSPLYATGWDRRSVLLCVLTDGKWNTYRIPKATQAYDHAWCTEWPRIREIGSGQLLFDMHGLFCRMSPEFPRPAAGGDAGALVPLSTHLRLVPDFCTWQDRLVMAGDEVISQSHRNRTGGQPQSNLLFTSLDEAKQWGPICAWGGPWYEDQVKGGAPSEPFLIGGLTNRVLHLSLGSRTSTVFRCAGRFEIVDLPRQLATLASVTIDRGSMDEPAPGYSLKVNRDVVVYLAVHDRGTPELPPGWEKTDIKVQWTHGGLYTDNVYKRSFKKGSIEIPGHNGRDERGKYGVPSMAFLAPDGPAEPQLEVRNLPRELRAQLVRPQVQSAEAATFSLEVDKDGSGKWTPYRSVRVSAGGYGWQLLPDDLIGAWVRITADRDTVATAQFSFGPRNQDWPRDTAIFSSLPPAADRVPRIHGGVLPLANRLWFTAYTSGADGARKPGGLYEVDGDMRFVRRAESIPGIFANRKMVGNLLSIGPHLVSDDGLVRTIQGLAGEHLVSTIRHPDPAKMYLLAADGRLLEVDLDGLTVQPACNIPEQLGLQAQSLQFKGGHLAGKTVLVAASTPDGKGGCLAEWDGRTWKVIDHAAFAEISNLGTMSEAVAAMGWDRASAILKMRSVGGQWTTYRLPKGSEGLDQAYAFEWPRLREVETERMLLDAHGIVYEMSGLLYAWSIRPVATHNRLISDFCSWRGMTVLAGNSAQAMPGGNYVRGGESAGLWFGKTDDLWQLGRPSGQGGPWLDTPVRAGQPSDPYLMTNFEHRRVELSHSAGQPVTFRLEIDFTVQAANWHTYKTLVVRPGSALVEQFPDGFSAHWVRVVADQDCTATARLVYE